MQAWHTFTQPRPVPLTLIIAHAGKQPDWSVTPTGGGGSGSLAGAPSREAAEAFARGGSGALAGGNQGAGMVLQRPGSGAGSTQFAAPGAQQGSFVAPGRLPGQPQSGQGFYAQVIYQSWHRVALHYRYSVISL